MAQTEADRFRDRSRQPTTGRTAPASDAGLDQSFSNPQEALAALVAGDTGVDLGDKTQNFGVADANRNSWDAGIYIGEVITKPDVTPADLAMLHSANPFSSRDLYGTAPSGFNVFDDMGNPVGFNRWGEARQDSFGGDAYLFYQEGPSGPNSRRAYLQQLLFRAGLVDRKNPEPVGGWGSPLDEDYRNAWEDAVRASQQSNIPLFVLLEQEAAALEARGGLGGGGGGGGGGGAGPRRPTAQIISEEDARSLVDEVAREQLGRALNDDEEDLAQAIVSKIRDKMSDEAAAVIDQQLAGGGTVSSPTNPRVTATEEVEQELETEAEAYDLATAFANLLGFVGGS